MTDDLRVIVDADADPLVRELKRGGGAVRGFGMVVGSQSRGTAAFNAALDKQRESLRGVTTFAKHASFAIGTGLALAIGHAIKVGMDFESQMARVQAVTGATAKEMDALRQLAIRLGADTKFSAGEAAEAMYELASAGFNVKETSKALPGTLALAAASSIDLATAAEISSNALRGFGLETKESTHVADVLAKSVNTSSVEMEDLQLSLKYIGPVARVTGESFEEMIAAVSLMGDAGIKGEQAGTSLRGGLLRLVKPTKQVQEGLNILSVSVEELQGPNGLLPLPQLVGKLQEGMKGLSKAEQAHALASVFGNEALSGMLTVVDAGPAKLTKLTEQFEHSNGASAKAARTMNDTVKGSFDQLMGSIETVEIQLYENFQEPLKEALLEATEIVNTEGGHLQDALEQAMSTPEFKQGDVGDKVEILVGAIGEELDRSDLPEEMGDALVDAFNYALPRVAEVAGHSAVTAAETFAAGFLKSDALGKLVIGGWLFTKLGGFAALKAAGAQAGTQVSIGMQEAITAQQAVTGVGSGRRPGPRSIPSRRAFPPSLQRPVMPTPVVAPEVELPNGKRRGLEWGKSFVKGFGTSMLIGGGIAGALAPADGWEAHMQNIVSGMTFGIVPEAGPSIGGELAISVSEAFDRELGPNIAKGLRQKTMGGLEEMQSSMRDLIAAAIANGAQEAELKPLRDRLRAVSSTVEMRFDFSQGIDSLESGLVIRMADIKKVVQRNTRDINQAWVKGGDQWRVATAKSMEAAVGAIRTGMRQGVIATGAGQKQINALLRQVQLTKGDDPIGIARGFADSWQKAGAVNNAQIAKVKTDLGKMPKDAREAAQNSMIQMARAMEAKGQLVKGSADRLRSALVTKFGQTNKQLTAGMGSAVKDIAGMFDSLAGAVGQALQGVGINVEEAMKAFGVNKAIKFAVHTPKAAANAVGSVIDTVGSLLDGGHAEGGFVNAPSRRDSVITALGRDEAVLNVHQQPEVQTGLAVAKGMGLVRHGSLGELFTGVTTPNYLASGGFAGGKGAGASKLPHPRIDGPSTLAALGQAGVDQAWEAAAKFLKQHMKAVAGGNIVEVGKSLQGLGYEVGEHPAFGGVAGVHTAGSDHYSGHAIDVNDDAAPYGHGSSEMSSLDWLAPQLLKLPHKQVIWRNRDLDTGAPIPAHMDHLHFAMALGGFVNELARGMAEGGWVKTGYTTYDVDGPGAYGNLMKGKGYAELGTATSGGSGTGVGFIAKALGMSGELPSEYPLDVKIGGKIGTLLKRDRGYGQGDPYYSIDIHHLGWDEVGLSGNSKGDAFIRPADGASSGAAEEKVPATYHGARTASLDLPSSMPDSLRGVERELTRRRTELGRYRAAAQKADKEGKPKIEQAIRANITALETRIQQLDRERAKLRREAAKRKFSRRVAKALGKVTGFESRIDAKKRIYEARSQFAEQVVGLEPTLPELPASATDAQREAAEKAFVGQLTSYVNTQEQPAYEAVLASETDWRDVILQGETKAAGQWAKGSIGGMEGAFENQIINLREEIDRINDLPKTHDSKWWHDHPKALQHLHEQMSKLPMMRFKEREVAKVLTEAREAFYPGGAKIKHPSPPGAGTGTFEVALAEVQGTHWPAQHERLEQLPSKRVAGTFGGAIWDTQEAIEGLGLKINQAALSASSGGSGSDGEDELKQLRLDRALEELAAERLKNAQLGTLQGFLSEFGPQLPYLGAFMQGTGGKRVGREGVAVLHRDEMITPDPKGPAGSQFAGPGGGGPSGPVTVQLVLSDKSGELVQLIDARVDGKISKIDQTIGRRGRQLAVAPGR